MGIVSVLACIGINFVLRIYEEMGLGLILMNYMKGMCFLSKIHPHHVSKFTKGVSLHPWSCFLDIIIFFFVYM